MKTAAAFAALMLFASADAFADHYIKAKTMGGFETETWTSGDKQRTQAAVPVMGQFITITRLDKGVEWTIDPGRKVYEEKPIALPYAPAGEESPAEPADWSGMRGAMGGDEAGECTPVVRELPEKRRIAGHEAGGYRSGCEESPEGGMTVWIAPAKGNLAQVEKESESFAKRRTEAMYKNYPAKERKELEKAAGMMQDAFKGMMQGMKGAKIPKGVPLAMEMDGAGQDGPFSGPFYEVSDIRTDAIAPQIFDVPGEYRKVESVAQERANAMLEQAGIDPDAMNRMFEQMGVSPEQMRQMEQAEPDYEE